MRRVTPDRDGEGSLRQKPQTGQVEGRMIRGSQSLELEQGLEGNRVEEEGEMQPWRP